MKTMQKSTLMERARVIAGVALVTLAGLPANAATTSFPQYPLLTGGSSIPPNILLILDDSGSMGYPKMPEDRSQGNMRDQVDDRSYINNTLYYNPATTYQPWRTASTDLSVRLSNADFTNAASGTTGFNNYIDLRDTSESYFYIPKSGVTNPGTTASNYDKYRIVTSSSVNSFNGGVVQKQVSSTTTLLNSSIASIATNANSSCISITTNSADSVAISTFGGSGDGDLYVYSNGTCSGGTYGTSKGNSNSESVTYPTPPGTISFKIFAYSKVSNINYTVTATTNWQDATPTGRSQQNELQNFANWYQYHRTRNKMAKAGASEAFGRLGKSYRVGFDTIWNRNAAGNTINTSGSTPAYPIPGGTDDGLFEDTGSTSNRTAFYSRLQGATANDGTPLHGALQRAGRYFATDDPWKDSSGNMLTCRQNYAILTTDGYWNFKDGFNSSVLAKYTDSNGNLVAAGDGKGNVDSGAGYPYQDNIAYTLADVAYYYWKNDLRPTMPNNVRSGSGDPATWQHMVTFGVSIGQQGNYDPTGNPPNPFPDVWLKDKYSDSTWQQSDGKQRIDDLWHAAINGHGSFVVATDTDKFASALSNALKSIDSRSASGSNVASSSTKTDSATLTFVAGFTSGSWIGDLSASPFNAGLTGLSTTPLWYLSNTFAAGGVNQPSAFASRTVLTDKGGVAAVLNSAVTNASDFAARTGMADQVSAVDNIAYLKGDQSKEIGNAGGTLRKRAYPMGDIVDSSPAYAEDTGAVYVGANDGMLHAIDSMTGKVLFSYVPKGVDFTAMASLSSTSYDHRYFVDGQIDVMNKVNQGNGKNILIAALGRGGRGVFALDVTNPSGMTPSNVLWDNTTQNPSTDQDMGYVLGAVRIRKGNGGKTYAFVPNGTDSQNGSATLYVYQLDANGGIAATTKLVADSSGGNGLMSLGMADLNGDGTVDTVYGGDLKGNIWRWDFSGAGVPSSAVKLFTAKDSLGTPQPITGGLGLGRDSSGNIFVGFGTGRFISNSDIPGGLGYTSQTQSFYGIMDKALPVAGRSALQVRTIPFSGTSSTGKPLRGFETYSDLPAGKQGWYIDLTPPERVISAPTIYGSAMVVTSVIPATGTDCAGATGSGFVNAIDLYTGTSPMSKSYLGDAGGIVKDSNGNAGMVGSIGSSGGMPTEANVTQGLVTSGTGSGVKDTSPTFSNTLWGDNSLPSRVNWREVVN